MLVLLVTFIFDNMQEFSYLDCKFAIFPALTDSCDIGTCHTFTRKSNQIGLDASKPVFGFFLKETGSNQSPQLHRLSRILKFCL